jgi:hypothetical protein
MQVKDCVLIEAFKCNEEDSVVDVAKKLREYTLRHIFVVNKEDYPVGLISVTDINNRVVAEGKNPNELKAKDIMTKPVDVIDENDDINAVYKSMLEKNRVCKRQENCWYYHNTPTIKECWGETMKQKKFTERYLDNMMQDKDIQKYFNNAKSDEEKELLKRGLKQAMDNSYEKFAGDYFGKKGFGSYVSSFLRWTGAAADVAGTYLFWTFGGAGFGMKGVGLVEKSLADVIDNRHYEKYRRKDGIKDKYITKDGMLIIGEGIAERAAAYLPIGVGEVADLLRGTKKYDAKIIGQALYHAKKEFIKQFGDYKAPEEPKIVPLENFRNPAYKTTIDEKVKKAA